MRAHCSWFAILEPGEYFTLGEMTLCLKNYPNSLFGVKNEAFSLPRKGALKKWWDKE